MTSAIHKITPSLSVPQTQDTAPVLEHNCLFTHDVKRKQKRWSDGYLRYHTFNKRIMVYDIPRNFIGDTHWTASKVIQEGDEVLLDKWGVLVEVADIIRRTETDLKELRKIQKKSAPALISCRTPGIKDSSRQSSTPAKHKSLNALLGTPKGVFGRASLPTQSPYEERHQRQGSHGLGEVQTLKRKRTDPVPEWDFIQITKAPLKQLGKPSYSPCPTSAKQKKSKSMQTQLIAKDVIDLCEDTDGQPVIVPAISSEALAYTSFPQQQQQPGADHKVKLIARSSPPTTQPQIISPIKRDRAATICEAAADDHEKYYQLAPQSRTGHACNVAQAIPRNTVNLSVDAQCLAATRPRTSLRQSTHPVPTSTSQFLKVAATSSRSKKTLFCQNQFSNQRQEGTIRPLAPVKTNIGAEPLFNSIDVRDCEDEAEQNLIHAKLEARLARIQKRYPDAVRGGEHQMQLSILEDDHQDDETNMHESQDEICGHAADVMHHQIAANQAGRPHESIMPVDAHLISRVRHPEPLHVPPQASPSRYDRPPQYVKTRHQSELDTPSPIEKSPQPVNGTAVAAVDAMKHIFETARKASASPSSKQNPAVSFDSAGRAASSPVALIPAVKGPGVMPDKDRQAPPIPASTEVGPWSREAFDLFIWRPPDWDEENWCCKEIM